MIGFSGAGKLIGLLIVHLQYLFTFMCHQSSRRKRGHTASVSNQFTNNAELEGTQASTFCCLTTLNGIFSKSVFDIGGNLSNYATGLTVLKSLNGMQHDKRNNVLL